MTHLVKRHLKHDSPSLCNHFSIFVEVEYVVKFREYVLIGCWYVTTAQQKKSIIQFRRDDQKTWMKHAHIDSDNVDLHRILLVWDGMGLPYLLPQDFIKQWLEGKLILSNMRSIFFMFLLYSFFLRGSRVRSLPAKQ